MSRSTRERWLTAFLPAAAIVGVYFWGWGRKSEQLLTQRASARSKVSPADAETTLLQRQKTLHELKEHLEGARAQARQLEQSARSLTVPDPSRRAAVARKVSDLLAARGLRLVSTGETPAAPPRELDEWTKAVGRWRAVPAPRMWRVEAEGAFPAMLAALTEIAHLEDFAVSASLEMKPDPCGAECRWILLLAL